MCSSDLNNVRCESGRLFAGWRLTLRPRETILVDFRGGGGVGEQGADELSSGNVARVFALDLDQLCALGWELSGIVRFARRVHVELLAAVGGDQRAASPPARGENREAPIGVEAQAADRARRRKLASDEGAGRRSGAVGGVARYDR